MSMATENHASEWFREVFNELQEQGKTADELRIAMYEKGFGYLKHVVENDSLHWNAKRNDVKDILKMIEYSQGWIR